MGNEAVASTEESIDAARSAGRPRRRFQSAANLAAESFGVAFVDIALAREREIFHGARQGQDQVDPDIDRVFLDIVFSSGSELIIEDAAEDERFSGVRRVVGSPRIRAFVGVPIHSRDGTVVGAIGLYDTVPRGFDDRTMVNVRSVAAWMRIELETVREADAAVSVQDALRPHDPAPLDGYEVAGKCTVARRIGGDFFDWYSIDDGMAITLGDVMGKGVGAGMLAAAVRASLRSAASELDPATAVMLTDRALAADFESAGSFTTLFHARLTASDGSISFVDAGHGLSLIVGVDGTTERLVGGYAPLGMLTGQDWESQRTRLNPGDLLISVSDGVLDLYDGSLESLSEVAKVARDAPSVSALVETIDALARAQGAPDDVTTIAVRRLS